MYTLLFSFYWNYIACRAYAASMTSDHLSVCPSMCRWIVII